MKEKYIGTLENIFGETTYLYTYADSIEKAKKNLEYQKSQKGELGMFKFIKVEKELKEDTNKEEIINEKEIQDKQELEEIIEYDGYYVSNMGKVFIKKDNKLKQIKARKSQSGKVIITFNKDTYNLNSIIYRAFNQQVELNPKTRIININGDINDNKLSNLMLNTEQDNKGESFNLNDLRKFSKNDLLNIINRMLEDNTNS